MAAVSRRPITYMALFMPAIIYMFLMFHAISYTCLKTENDRTDTGLREQNPRLKDSVRHMDYQYLNGDKSKGRQESYENIDTKRRQLMHDSGKSMFNDSEKRTFLSFVSSFKSEGYVRNTQHVNNRILFNCSTISKMKIKHKIGHGVSKEAFVAEYNGVQYAIKMVTRHIHDVKNCLQKLQVLKNGDTSESAENAGYAKNQAQKNFDVVMKMQAKHHEEENTFYDRRNSEHEYKIRDNFRDVDVEKDALTAKKKQDCYLPPSARLMKEILLSLQLQHPNLAQLLGYCVRSEESDTTDISEHGIVSVYELGTRFALDNLQLLPWPTRLTYSIDLADLLVYLSESPLGSLVLPDLKESHLIMVSDTIKVIDLDDVNNLEPDCGFGDREPTCPYGLRCVRALCEGFNAKENLNHLNKLVFKRLLFPLTYPSQVVQEIGQLNAKLDSLSMDARELRERLRAIQVYLKTVDLS